MEKLKSFFHKNEPNHHKEDSSQTSPYLTKALNEDLSFGLFKIQQKLDQRKFIQQQLDQKKFILRKKIDDLQVKEKRMKKLMEKSKDVNSKTFL